MLRAVVSGCCVRLTGSGRQGATPVGNVASTQRWSTWQVRGVETHGGVVVVRDGEDGEVLTTSISSMAALSARSSLLVLAGMRWGQPSKC
jgi:hypothetical protein